MINYKDGDIFESQCEAIVNPVNCEGVMGRGLAKEFKIRYPDYFKDYKLKCNDGLVNVGKVDVYINHGNPDYIISFPTKDRWRYNSKLWWIENGLMDLSFRLIDHGIKSVAIPALGCGLGGLDWVNVKEAINAHLGRLNDIRVLVYIPY